MEKTITLIKDSEYYLENLNIPGLKLEYKMIKH